VGRPPQLGVFAVDDRSTQLTWRHLRPGSLELAIVPIGSVTPSGTYVAAGTTPTSDPDVAMPHPAEPDLARAVPEPWVELGGGRFRLPEGASAGPGSVVIGGLPAGRLFTIVASGPALGDERSIPVRTLDALPGPELCRIATLSDLHIGTYVFGQRGTIREHPTPQVPHPQRCTAAAIEEAVGWGAERLVVKGDLTNQGAPHHWEEYARLVHASPVPVDALPGNHDHAHPHAGDNLAPAEAAVVHDLSIADPIIVRDLPGLRLILVDSTRPGQHGGSVRATQAQLLDLVSDADPEGGVLVALHHQLQPHALPEGWPSGISRHESFDLLDRLGSAHRHVLVTSGHTHRHRRWGRAGVAVTQVGSTKDYPGVWAGYVVHEGGMYQTVRRVGRPDCLAWTDYSRRAAAGMWRHVAPGRLDARCFTLPWSVPF
jgi:Icc protein